MLRTRRQSAAAAAVEAAGGDGLGALERENQRLRELVGATCWLLHAPPSCS